MKPIFIVALFLVFSSCSKLTPAKRSTNILNTYRAAASLDAATVNEVEEGFLIQAEHCQLTVLDMRNGVLESVKIVGASLVCSKTGQSSFKCKYFDEKNKEYGIEDFSVNKTGAIITGSSRGDSFEGNLVTRKVFWNTNINIKDSTGRGVKTCSGEFFFNSELDSLSKLESK